MSLLKVIEGTKAREPGMEAFDFRFLIREIILLILAGNERKDTIDGALSLVWIHLLLPAPNPTTVIIRIEIQIRRRHDRANQIALSDG